MGSDEIQHYSNNKDSYVGLIEIYIRSDRFLSGLIGSDYRNDSPGHLKSGLATNTSSQDEKL